MPYRTAPLVVVDLVRMDAPVPWNVAHVVNALSQTGCVPPDRVNETKAILEMLLSNSINGKRMEDAFYGVRRMHHELGKALEGNDLLRARALIVDWEKEYC